MLTDVTGAHDVAKVYKSTKGYFIFVKTDMSDEDVSLFTVFTADGEYVTETIAYEGDCLIQVSEYF